MRIILSYLQQSRPRQKVPKPRHTARVIKGRTPKKKRPFLFEKKIGRAQNQESKERFSSVSAEALRGGGGVESERTIKFQATTRSERTQWLQSRIFDKVGSSRVVKTHNKSQITSLLFLGSA